MLLVNNSMFFFCHHRNEGSRNAKHFGYSGMRHGFVHLVNIPNLVIRKFGSMVLFSFRVIPSSFFDFICHVVFWRPKEKVVRVDTRRVVALMKNIKLIRNLALMDEIGKSMGSNCFFVKPESPVAVIKLPSRPEPAFISLIDMEKKALFVRHVSSGVNGSIAPLSKVMLIAESFGAGRGGALKAHPSINILVVFLFWSSASFVVIVSMVTFFAHTLKSGFGYLAVRTNHRILPIGFNDIIPIKGKGVKNVESS